MMLLKNNKDVENLFAAVEKCHDNVYLRAADGSEEFNLKDGYSRSIAVQELRQEGGDEYEVFCSDRNDEGYMMEFFDELRRNAA